MDYIKSIKTKVDKFNAKLVEFGRKQANNLADCTKISTPHMSKSHLKLSRHGKMMTSTSNSKMTFSQAHTMRYCSG